MKERLLIEAREFEKNLLDKYPNVHRPPDLISRFIRILNESAPEIPECGEEINSVLNLLNDSDLQKFAEASFQKANLIDQLREEYEMGDHHGDDDELNDIINRAGLDADEIEANANIVVYGDEDSEIAGLKESVSKLISCLE